MKWIKIATAVSITAATAAGFIACSSDDNVTTTTQTDASTFDSGGGGADSGGSTDSGPGVDAGTLYDRLQGHAGIHAFVTASVQAAVKDPVQASYFGAFKGDPTHTPTGPEIVECFTDLVGQAAGGPEIYPTTVTITDDAGADAGAFTCRDMTSAHAALHIPGPIFDQFITIVGGVAVANLGQNGYTYTAADISTLATVLTGTRSDIVDPTAGDASTCFGGGFGCLDAGDGG
jgi:hypothetical protein